MNRPYDTYIGDKGVIMHTVYLFLLYLSTRLHKFVRSNFRLWRYFTRHQWIGLNHIGYLYAGMRCALAYKTVPAYRQFVGTQPAQVLMLEKYPETNKENYVKRYPVHERAIGGRLKIAGTVVDESSGSSGSPMNWVRSRDELKDIHRDTANYIRLHVPGDKLFTINAFSMGAWATGTNTGIALAKVGMVKSTGPEIDKVLDTMLNFGSGFDYIISGYPPFLKHLCDAADSRGFHWEQYTLYGFVGGEAMTEALRDYLEQRFQKVYSAYGATDLQIGFAVEFDFTIWLRKQLLSNPRLRERILGIDEQRVPMVFQYNPLDNYIEINDNSEVVVTVNNLSVMCPRLRYNVGDEGRIYEFADIAQILEAEGFDMAELKRRFKADFCPFPILLLYGRKDSTISYMGANIYPQDVEYGLYQHAESARVIESFCLSLEETTALEQRVTVNIELRESVYLSETERAANIATYRQGIVDYLAQINRDFAQSLAEDPSTGDIQIRSFDYGTGIFANKNHRIKNKYLVRETTI